MYSGHLFLNTFICSVLYETQSKTPNTENKRGLRVFCSELGNSSNYVQKILCKEKRRYRFKHNNIWFVITRMNPILISESKTSKMFEYLQQF